MDMVLGNGGLLTGKTLAKELEESLKNPGQTKVAAIAAGTATGAAGLVTGGGDTVEISDEARRQLARSTTTEGDSAAAKAGQSTVSAQVGGAGAEKTEEQTAADTAKEDLAKQIREVQKKLEDAKARLAEAMASAGAPNGAASAQSTQKASVFSNAGAEGSEASEQSAGSGVADAALSDSSMEVKAIQVEISNLNSQLMTLYKRQQELSQTGGGGGAVMDGLGTRAGINTPGIGVPGGKGQRMPLNA